MDYDIYTTEMSKSIWDKAFFMDKIPGAKCVIDFGCADGAMIRTLGKLFPDITFIGYDFNTELIARAMSSAPFLANVVYFQIFENVIEFVKSRGFSRDEICINFSSVLHEVYSESPAEILMIRHAISDIQPKYITIRDMYCDEEIPFTTTDHRNILDIITSRQKTLERAIEFKNKFGVINNWKKMMHLLMKLQWVDNGYKEELNEDYFSWNIYDFINELNINYAIQFECRYQLPYLSEMWKNKYNWYNPDIHTHAQFILRRME